MRRDQILQVRLTRKELKILHDEKKQMATSLPMSDFIRSKLGISKFAQLFTAGERE